ncbi:MAG: ATP-dependent metallopeptidase FtsH/Yme1/Tma family protein [Acidobacteriota bacterium]
MNQQPPRRKRRKRPGGGSAGAIRTMLWFVLLLGLAFWFWTLISGVTTDATRISYTDFRSQLEGGNISRITVSGEEIEGTLKSPTDRQNQQGQLADYNQFITYLPSFGDEQLMATLQAQGVEIETEPEQDFSWGAIFLNLLPFIFLIWLFSLLFRGAQAQGRSILKMGQSRARTYDRSRERIAFEDVAGSSGAKTELKEINPVEKFEYGVPTLRTTIR